MPSYQPVSFQSPGYDYGTDLSQIERRRAMAAMLQKEGLSQEPQQQVAPGQFAVPYSPFQGAAKMAQILAAKRQEKKADEQQRNLATTAQSNLASVLMNAQKAASGTPATALSEDASGNVTPAQPAVPGDSSKAASIYMQHPQTAQLGQSMMQSELAQQARQRALAQILGPQAPPAAPAAPNAAAGGSAPAYGSPGFSPQGAAPQQAQGAPNPLAGISPQALALMTSGDAELSKVGSALHTSGQTQGRVFYDQHGNAFSVNHAGQAIPLPGIQQRVKPEAVNVGGETHFVDPYKQTQPLPHTLTPQNRAENWWNMGNPDPMGQPQQPPAPGQPGLTVNPQGVSRTLEQPAPRPNALSPLQVPPKEKAKLESERPQADFAARSVMDGLGRASSQIDKVLASPGLSNITGPVAGRTPNMSGAATNAQAHLDTLKAQLGVQELQRMREASKTGGAVGSVTEKEWPILQNQLGALQQAQTTAEFRKGLEDVKVTLERMQGNTRRAYETTYGRLNYTPATPPKPAAPRVKFEDL